jgi:hypothetical protein
MEKYITQLIGDIVYATKNVSTPFAEKELEIHDWISNEEEDKMVPVRNLQDWTGIYTVMLPKESLLNDDQVHRLLTALINLLTAYNWHFVMQFTVPERIQYKTIRYNFDQPAKLKRWNMGFFELCKPGTEKEKCTLGEYCHCAFYEEIFKNFIDEELSPAEERARALEIEVQHIKRKYGDRWMKYYPYHLNSEYDDENGNPYNYGFGDEEEDDNWWRS